MKLHSYHPRTGEYLGEIDAPENPRAPGQYLAPAFCATDNPPEIPEGSAAVWRDGQWVILADNRGTEYWLPDGSRHVIEDLGESVPAGALLVAPPPPAPGLEQVQQAEIAAVLADFEAQKLAGIGVVMPGVWGAFLETLDYTATAARAAILEAETVEAARAVRAAIVWDAGLPGGAG